MERIVCRNDSMQEGMVVGTTACVKECGRNVCVKRVWKERMGCNHSELLLPEPLLNELERAVVVVGEVVVLVVLERAFHDLEQLAFARVVDPPDFGFDLVEPHLDRVELGGVGGQVHHLHVPLFSQLHGLLLVVDGAVVHYQPLLPLLVLLYFVELFEELLDEVQVLVLAVGALDDAPVG